jgi:hypothetical protein
MQSRSRTSAEKGFHARDESFYVPEITYTHRKDRTGREGAKNMTKGGWTITVLIRKVVEFVEDKINQGGSK